MTNIQFLKDRIIIDGHAETKEQCETITLLCNNLAKSKDFKTVRYESGYAEFEKINNAKELKFFAPTEEADITLIWDSGIISVTGVPNDTGGSYTWTASNTAKTVTAIFGDYETITYTPVLKDGYVIDTVTTNNDGSSAADTINIANDKKSFAVSLLYPHQYATITITTKQSGSSDNLTWVINETPTTEPLGLTQNIKIYNANFTSNGTTFENIGLSNEMVPGKPSNLANIIYNAGLSSTESVYNSGMWENEAYRTIKFETAPTGELLQWLEQNATQGSSTTKQQIDLSTLSGWANLSSGQHSITVKAKASGYGDSAASNAVSVEKGTQVYADCLTFTGKTGDFTLKATNKKWNGTLEWSTDHTTWKTLVSTETMQSVDKKLYLRGKGNTVFYEKRNGYLKTGVEWRLSEKADCAGNIQTLLDWENPPTIISETRCYQAMFKGCTNLTAAPELPATTLANNCYMQMFEGCTNLTSASELLATTFADGCYYAMFRDCTKLKVNSVSGTKIFTYLTTMPDGAAYGMFENTGGTFTGTPTAGNTYYYTV